MATKVKPCIVSPSQDYKRIKGKMFKYHIRATSKTGAFLNRTLCGNGKYVKQNILITYTELHNASGIAKLCSFCRNKQLG